MVLNHRKSLLSAAVTLGLAVGGLGVAAIPAQAITCLGTSQYNAKSEASSSVFHVAYSPTSLCMDLNVAYTHSNNDTVRGWYKKQNGTWTVGSKGWVVVSTSTSNSWKVLISDILDGTDVRGQTTYYNQNVRYVS